MRRVLILALMLFLLVGCAEGRFSVNGGRAKYAIPFDWPGPKIKNIVEQCDSVYVGMKKEQLKDLFAKFKQDGSRREDNQEWITYICEESKQKSTVTFYLVDDKVKDWRQGLRK